MNNITIAVLRGGPSNEYEVSLKTGASIINALEGKYKIIDILIDKNGDWHRNGLLAPPADALMGVDVAVLALHGEYGEDGTVQRLLDALGIPYTGSGAEPSALAMHKPRTRYKVDTLPMIKFPEHYLIREDEYDYAELAQDIFKRFGPPYIVKPATGGSSVGLVVVKTLPELPDAIEYVRRHTTDDLVMVEQYIIGKEVTCGVVESFREQDHYALPPIEIIPPKEKDGLYDYEAKYSDDPNIHASMQCPADFNNNQKRQIEQAAIAVHKALELSHYSRSDFIMSPHGLYFLEVNTLPGLTQQSLLPVSLKAVGSSLEDFLEHIVNLAIENK